MSGAGFPAAWLLALSQFKLYRAFGGVNRTCPREHWIMSKSNRVGQLFMRRRTTFLVMIITVGVLFFFLLPLQGVVNYGGCAGCSQHYERSFSCQVFAIGVYYWDNELTLGCGSPHFL